MHDLLINRFVKILKSGNNNAKDTAGTGILLDSRHILTCAHVVETALPNCRSITSEERISISPMCNSTSNANDNLTAKVVLSWFAKVTTQDGRDLLEHDIPNLRKLSSNNLKDLILLEAEEEVLQSAQLINWQTKDANTQSEIEGFGYHKDAGDCFEAITKGKRHHGIHQFNLLKDTEENLGGASGAALFPKDCTHDNLISYGITIAQYEREGKKLSDVGYFIPGNAVADFLRRYRNGSLLPSRANDPFKPTQKPVLVTRFLAESNGQGATNYENNNIYSLIDRRFLESVDDKLRANHLVCLTLKGTEIDWLYGIGIRIINADELLTKDQDNQGKVIMHVDWPHNSNKYTSGDIVFEVAKQIVKRLLHDDHSMQRSLQGYQNNTDNIRTLLEDFVCAMKNKKFKRVVIDINLTYSLLAPVEQQAMQWIVKAFSEFHMGNSASREQNTHSQSQPQILLNWIVNRSKVPAPSLWHKLRVYLQKRNHRTIATVMQALQQQNLCSHVELTEPLQPIVESDIDDWIDLLKRANIFHKTHIDRLRDAAQSVIKTDEGVRHKHFRDGIKTILKESGMVTRQDYQQH